MRIAAAVKLFALFVCACLATRAVAEEVFTATFTKIGFTATVTFAESADGAHVLYTTNVTSHADGKSLFTDGIRAFIHEYSTLASGTTGFGAEGCATSVVGAVWDPTFQGPTQIATVGNLHVRWDLIPNEADEVHSFEDSYLKLSGPTGISGRSVVLYSSDDDTPVMCATIVAPSKVTPIEMYTAGLSAADSALGVSKVTIEPRIAQPELSAASYFLAQFTLATTSPLIGRPFYFGATACAAATTANVPEKLVSTALFTPVAGSNEVFNGALSQVVYYGQRSIFATKADGSALACFDLVAFLNGATQARVFTNQAVVATFSGADINGTVTFTPLNDAETMISTNIVSISTNYYPKSEVEWDIYENGAFTSSNCNGVGNLFPTKSGLYSRHGTLRVGINNYLDTKATKPFNVDSYLGRPLVAIAPPATGGTAKQFVSCPRILDPTNPQTARFASVSFTAQSAYKLVVNAKPRMAQHPTADVSYFSFDITVNTGSTAIGAYFYIGATKCPSASASVKKVTVLGDKLHTTAFALGGMSSTMQVPFSPVDMAGRSLVLIIPVSGQALSDTTYVACDDWLDANLMSNTNYDRTVAPHTVTLNNDKIKGTISFQQVSTTDVIITTKINYMDTAAFPNGALWHIHEFGGVTNQLSCGATVTGGHWDPNFDGMTSPKEVGNLSGRYGKLVLSKEGNGVAFLDSFFIYKTTGARGIIGRSVVVHKSDAAAGNPRVACNDIVSGTPVTPATTSVFIPADFKLGTCDSAKTVLLAPRFVQIPGATMGSLQFNLDTTDCAAYVGAHMYIGLTGCSTTKPSNMYNGPIDRLKAGVNKFMSSGMQPDVALEARSLVFAKDDGSMLSCFNLARLDGGVPEVTFGTKVETGIATGIITMQEINDGNVLVTSNVYPGYTDFKEDWVSTTYDVTAAIITNAIPADKSCNFDTDLTLFNPTNATTDADVVGNLYARHGLYEKNAEQSRYRSFVDSKIKLSGENSVVGKTFVLYLAAEKPFVLACGVIGTMNDRIVLSYTSAQITGELVMSSYVSVATRKPKFFVGNSLWGPAVGALNILHYTENSCAANNATTNSFSPFVGVAAQSLSFTLQSSPSVSSTSYDFDLKTLYGRTAYYLPSTTGAVPTCATVQPYSGTAVAALTKSDVYAARSRVYVTNTANDNKITIDVQFDQRASSNSVDVFLGVRGDLTLLGSAGSAGLKWHVHVVSAQKSGSLGVCNAIGGHFNPTFSASGVEEVGDLASRLGNLKLELSDTTTDYTNAMITRHYVDSKISLKPDVINIVGRSLGVHNPTGTDGFFGCGTIYPGANLPSFDATLTRTVTVDAQANSQSLSAIFVDPKSSPYRPSVIYNAVVENANTDGPATVTFGFHKYSVASNSTGAACGAAYTGGRVAENGDLLALAGVTEEVSVPAGSSRTLQRAAVFPSTFTGTLNDFNGMTLVLKTSGNDDIAQCGAVYINNNPIPEGSKTHTFSLRLSDMLASSGASKEEHLGSKMLDKLVAHLKSLGGSKYTSFMILSQEIFTVYDADDMVLDMINMNVAAVKLAGGFDVRGAKHVYVIVNVAGVAANSSSTQADADAFQATIKSSNIQSGLGSQRYSIDSVSASMDVVAATCFDDIKDNGETDIDCGNTAESSCSACKPGQKCDEDSDCTTNICTSSICASGPDNAAAATGVSFAVAALLMLVAVIFA